jgi:hypothetical protein
MANWKHTLLEVEGVAAVSSAIIISNSDVIGRVKSINGNRTIRQ